MKPKAHFSRWLPLLITVLASLALAPSTSATPPSRAGLSQLGDPYVPPQVRAAARAMLIAPPATGARLQTLALDKLQAEFSKADAEHSGRVSKVQAQKSGFGFVVNHFDQIDAHQRGSVSFSELKAYMRANGANF